MHRRIILTALLLSGACTPRAGLKLDKRGLGPADAELLDLMFENVTYEGHTLRGRVMLYAMDDVDIPNILDWRTVLLDRVWNCETHDDVPLAHVDYAATPNERPDVLQLRKGDFYGRAATLPVSDASPDCIRYELVYAPDGQFRGPHAIKLAGTAQKTPPLPPIPSE